mmetsp:Transcript_14159/g.24165  ORF Transcript_14159/g.24165 Transcript_14159/m.24165 type:complete len:225 (-) Transcript_14159:176-850(-)|eukprot:CAMPEP_0183736170 /NCGR_PEP_ID=MMETSP0737-20130205/48660_1 /TAXON_ID=385413 /ORGANISM="Thalassiosira miniscula, Strain CCMP1093" /LENGTH=224 /DNA_ID=CAMNT_0025970107 /DNA_START=122 /DNA_END=796 /DNA_ORIENTATION=+
MGFLFRRRVKSSPKIDAKRNRKRRSDKNVKFTDIPAERHEYEFDWELEHEYWFSRVELKAFKEERFDDADILRKERGIRTSSRNDADELSSSRRILFIGDKITHALDDNDGNHEISVRGIEHFVFPVLQKEMVGRKKELKRIVIGHSRDPKLRKLDPDGIKLAKESAELSKWARDVASERGIKYCQMKRGVGKGGGLLKSSKMMGGAAGRALMRGLSLSEVKTE